MATWVDSPEQSIKLFEANYAEQKSAGETAEQIYSLYLLSKKYSEMRRQPEAEHRWSLVATLIEKLEGPNWYAAIVLINRSDDLLRANRDAEALQTASLAMKYIVDGAVPSFAYCGNLGSAELSGRTLRIQARLHEEAVPCFACHERP